MHTEIYTTATPQPMLDAPCVRLPALHVDREASAKRRRAVSKRSKKTEKLVTATVSERRKKRRTVQPAESRDTSRLKRIASAERSAEEMTSIPHAHAVAKQSSIEKTFSPSDSPAEPTPSLAQDTSAEPQTPPQTEGTVGFEGTVQPLATWNEDPGLSGEIQDQMTPASSCAPVEEFVTSARSSRAFITMLRLLARSALSLLTNSWSCLQQRLKSQQAKKRLRVCETVSLGEKRFIAVIQVDGEQFLVGGSSSSVSTLAHLEQPCGFPESLRRSYQGGNQA